MINNLYKVEETVPEGRDPFIKVVPGRSRGDKGFTMLEVVIAMGVLAVALIGLASLATSNLKSTESARRLTQAINIGMEKMEMLEAVPSSNLQFSDAVPLNEDGNVERSCGGGAGSPPVFTCTPDGAAASNSAPEVTMDGMDFTWGWTVTYVDLDGDGNEYAAASGAPLIDSRDIKKVDLTVTWTDIFGSHNTTFTVLRSRL